MTSRKRRRSREHPGDARGQADAPTAPRSRGREGTGGTASDRRARKERAREERRRARRAERWRKAVRRLAAVAAVGAVVAGTLWYLGRAAGRDPIPAAAVRAAAEAGCTTPTRQFDEPERGHLPPSQIVYRERPATAGAHEAVALPVPPHVYDAPVPETRAVHALEHGAVILYYRPDGPGALAPDVVERLRAIAEGSRASVLAPYPDLPEGVSFALAAWNLLQTCPAGLAPEQATTIAEGFIASAECKGQPEPGIPPC